ncbi:MAG: Glutathione S-transferase, partial [uncultured Acetobacteraceae bacterium]
DPLPLQPGPEPDEGRPVPGGGRAALRGRAGRHPQGRAVRPGLRRAEPEQQGAGDRGRRGHRVRQQRHPALPGREDRPVPAPRANAGGARRAALLAHVRGDRRRAVFRAGRALPAFRARAEGVRRHPLPVRGAAALRHPRRAPGRAPLRAGRGLHHRGHGGLGLGAHGAVHPGRRRLGGDAQPEAAAGRDRRPAGRGARARPQGPPRLQGGDGRGSPAPHVPPRHARRGL